MLAVYFTIRYRRLTVYLPVHTRTHIHTVTSAFFTARADLFTFYPLQRYRSFANIRLSVSELHSSSSPSSKE